ncbi:MAG: LVIVD repeat-containing protein [Candidatus Dormibacteria bacterium]
MNRVTAPSNRSLTRSWQAGLAALVAFVLAGAGIANAQVTTSVYAGPTPRAHCGPGGMPETGRQGRITQADLDSGRAAQGFQCNLAVLGHFGQRGGYKVERYVDKAGHECAYYDTTLLFPKDAVLAAGVNVLDMTDPAHPALTANLTTPAMLTPHESILLNQKRGLLVGVSANPAFYPGIVDVYDVSADCRNPVLQSSLPVGTFGHESGFAPDGNTFYSSSLDGGFITAIDLTNPMLTKPVWFDNQIGKIHGLSIRDDGNRAYLATRAGLIILDTSQVQARVVNPVVPVVSSLTWPTMSTPQITIPVTIKGHSYLVEIDEFGGGSAKIGAARIIDIADDRHPAVISNIRLEVNMAENQAGQANDPGATTTFRGYAGHYCEVPSRVEPGVVACTFILSGLRLFDIHDPYHPKELGYFNPPPRKVIPGAPAAADPVSNYAMSKPTFVPRRNEIWYSDGNNGFYVLGVANNVWTPTRAQLAGGAPGGAPATIPAAAAGGRLSSTPGTSTGGPVGYSLLAFGSAGMVLALGLGVVRQRRRG